MQPIGLCNAGQRRTVTDQQLPEGLHRGRLRKRGSGGVDAPPLHVAYGVVHRQLLLLRGRLLQQGPPSAVPPLEQPPAPRRDAPVAGCAVGDALRRSAEPGLLPLSSDTATLSKISAAKPMTQTDSVSWNAAPWHDTVPKRSPAPLPLPSRHTLC